MRPALESEQMFMLRTFCVSSSRVYLFTVPELVCCTRFSVQRNWRESPTSHNGRAKQAGVGHQLVRVQLPVTKKSNPDATQTSGFPTEAAFSLDWGSPDRVGQVFASGHASLKP